MKQAWRIHTNKNSLVHRLNQAKYHLGPLSAALAHKKSPTSSYTYRSLWKASDLLREGFTKQIGNGNNTEIEKDIWAGEKLLRQRALNPSQFPNFNPTLHTKVVDLINGRGEWNTILIWNIFHRSDAERILSIHLQSMEQEDQINLGAYQNRELYSQIMLLVFTATSPAKVQRTSLLEVHMKTENKYLQN